MVSTFSCRIPVDYRPKLVSLSFLFPAAVLAVGDEADGFICPHTAYRA
jgi:hypothetical protein